MIQTTAEIRQERITLVRAGEEVKDQVEGPMLGEAADFFDCSQWLVETLSVGGSRKSEFRVAEGYVS